MVVYPQPIPVYTPPPPPQQQNPVVATRPAQPLPPSIAASAVARLHNIIFIGTFGKIRALEVLENGRYLKPVWDNELKGTGYHMVHLSLHTPTGRLYAATFGKIYCFDALTGNTIWTSKHDSKTGLSAPRFVTLLLSQDGMLLISATCGSIAAFSAATGQEVWSHGFGDAVQVQNVFSLLEHNGLIFVGRTGYVYALSLATGQQIWKNGLNGYGFGQVSLAAYTYTAHGSYTGDLLFVGISGYVLALDARTGNTRKEVNLEGTGYHPVAFLVDPANDRLYTATSGEIRCFKGESMNQVWKSTLPGMGYSLGHSLLFSGANIIVGMNGKVGAVDIQTGKGIWTRNLPKCGFRLVTVASVANEKTLICGSAGHLYCVSKDDGYIQWENDLPRLGHAEICLSTTTFNTNFNSSTVFLAIRK